MTDKKDDFRKCKNCAYVTGESGCGHETARNVAQRDRLMSRGVDPAPYCSFFLRQPVQATPAQGQPLRRKEKPPEGRTKRQEEIIAHALALQEKGILTRNEARTIIQQAQSKGPSEGLKDALNAVTEREGDVNLANKSKDWIWAFPRMADRLSIEDAVEVLDQALLKEPELVAQATASDTEEDFLETFDLLNEAITARVTKGTMSVNAARRAAGRATELERRLKKEPHLTHRSMTVFHDSRKMSCPIEEIPESLHGIIGAWRWVEMAAELPPNNTPVLFFRKTQGRDYGFLIGRYVRRHTVPSQHEDDAIAEEYLGGFFLPEGIYECLEVGHGRILHLLVDIEVSHWAELRVPLL